MNFKIFIFILIITALNVSASDYMMYIGGSGDLTPIPTFDLAIEKIGPYIKSRPSLNIDIAFNGGHAKTEALINQTFPNAQSKSSFYESDYKRLIKSYQEKIETMSPNDQIMIYIDAHGAIQEPKIKTHRIATTGKNPTELSHLSGGTLANLDELEVLKKRAKEKNIRLAIIDSSCHSGNTLALADDNTCVIASTGPNHFGHNSFSQVFASSLQPGKSLEEVFLQARDLDQSPNFPTISTSAGERISNLIYNKIGPYLNSFSAGADHMTDYLRENNGLVSQCTANYNHDFLIELINQIEKLNNTSELDFSLLKNLLNEYKEQIDIARVKMRELKTDRLNKDEALKGSFSEYNPVTRIKTTNSWSQKFSWKELMTTDFDARLSQIPLPNPNDKKSNLSYKFNSEVYSAAKKRREEILRDNPDLLTLPAKEKEIQNLVNLSLKKSTAIGVEERKLYSILYKRFTNSENKTSPKPNPCKNFRL